MEDNGLHIDITGENDSLKSAVEESERLLDNLGEKAEAAGEKLRHFFDTGSVMTDTSIMEMFKDFSIDEYVKEMEQFVAAGGDAASQAGVLDMALRSMKNALDSAPIDNNALTEELNGVVENIKAAKQALEAQVLKDAEGEGFNFTFSSGNSDIMTQEEIDKMEAARDAVRETTDAVKEYEEVVGNRSQVPPVTPPTPPNNGGGSNNPATPPIPPADTRSIKEIEDEIKKLDKTIDGVTAKQVDITAMFDSYRGADAAAMSIRGLNKANDEISDGFQTLGQAQDAYNTKIADLESIAKKQEEALNSLKVAQEQAINNGDNRGAANALAEYGEMQEKLQQTRDALEQTRNAAANLGIVVDNNADVQNRYNDVLDAANMADATNEIGDLQKAFDEEKNIMEDCGAEMGRMQEELAELQKQMASNKLTPDEKGEAQKKIDDLRKKIAEVANAYQIASERAKQFGSKIGQTVPDVKLNTGNNGGDDGASASVTKVGSAAKDASTQLGKLRMNVTSITRGFNAMSKGGSGVITGLAGIGKGVMGLSAQLMTLLANPIVAIIAAIVAALMVLYKLVTKFINGTSAGADMFASWIGYVKGFKAAIEQFTMEVSRKVAEFVKSFGSLGSSIGASLKVAWTWISSWGTEIINFFGVLGDSLKTYFSAKLNDIGGAIKNGWTKTKAWFKGEEVKEEDLVDTNSADGAFDGLKKAAADFGKTAKNEVGSSIEDMKARWSEFSSGFSKFEMPSFKDFMETYARIEELQRGIIKKQREWTVASAQLESQQAELQDQLSRAGNVDKLQKMAQLQDLITKKYDGELSIARDELKVQQEMNRLKGKNVSDDDLKKEADLTAKVLGIEQKRTNEMRSLTNQHTDLTRQLEEERREQARVLANNAREKEIAALQQKLKYEKDVTKQLEIQDEIRKKQLEKELNSIGKQQQGSIKSALGADAEQAFANGASKDELKAMFVDNEAAQLEIDRLFQYYDKLRSDAIAKSEQEGAFADYDKDYQAYMKYCEDVIAAEEWKQEELRKIAAGESTMTEDQVNRVYDNQVQQAAKNANLDDAELKLTDIATDFEEKIANATVDGIEEAMRELEDSINSENNLISKIMGMTDEQKAARTEELNTQLTADQAIAADETQSPEARAEAEERIMNAKREILLLSYDQQQLDGQKTKNQEVLDRMTQKGLEKQKQGNQVISKNTIKNMRDMKALSSSLGAVGDMADAVADTFGGSLSKGAKKALGAISDIAKTGTSVISGIENLVNVATKGMTVTAAAGVAQMSALEKASFILTILSVAVQAITAIAQFLMKFTAAAKMQEQIDEHLEKVKQLQYEHDKLERAYQNSAGTDYYKKMSAAAKDYDNLLAEQNKALAEANKLYEYQASKYGEDSGKAKDAKEQAQEIEKQRNEFADAQKQMYQDMMEGLSGTDLQSFSQNLADALVDGFAQGKDGIEDVWEDTMDDLMRTMMKQQLALAITDMFKPVFDKLNDYTKNGELNQSEIDAIMSEFDAKSAQAKALAEQYYNLMNERGLLEDADTDGSQGFGQMTQDQADTLTARFTALQMEGSNVVATAQLILEQMLEVGADSKLQVASLQTLVLNSGMCMQIAQEQLDQLQIIADNTELLNETNTRLRAIEQNTGKL